MEAPERTLEDGSFHFHQPSGSFRLSWNVPCASHKKSCSGGAQPLASQHPGEGGLDLAGRGLKNCAVEIGVQFLVDLVDNLLG